EAQRLLGPFGHAAQACQGAKARGKGVGRHGRSMGPSTSDEQASLARRGTLAGPSWRRSPEVNGEILSRRRGLRACGADDGMAPASLSGRAELAAWSFTRRSKGALSRGTRGRRTPTAFSPDVMP